MTRNTRTLRSSWKLPRYKKEWRSICAVLPKYLADGTNGTAIYYIDGSIEEVEYRLVYVLDDLLGYLNTSKELLHKQSALLLEAPAAYRLPLVVDNDFCLVPVKGRKAISKPDGTMGYIVLQYVQAVQTVDNDTLVHMAMEQTVVLHDSERTIKRNLKLARALQNQSRKK